MEVNQVIIAVIVKLPRGVGVLWELSRESGRRVWSAPKRLSKTPVTAAPEVHDMLGFVV